MSRPRWISTGAIIHIGRCQGRWTQVLGTGDNADQVAFEWHVECAPEAFHQHGVCKRLRCARRAILRIANRFNRELKRAEARAAGQLVLGKTLTEVLR